MNKTALRTIIVNLTLAGVACGGELDETAGSLEQELAGWSENCWGTNDPNACNCYERAGDPAKACPLGSYCTPQFSCQPRGQVDQLCVVNVPLAQSDPSCAPSLSCCPDASLEPTANGGFDGYCRVSCTTTSSGSTGSPTISSTTQRGGSAGAGGSRSGGSSAGTPGCTYSAAISATCSANCDCQVGLGCNRMLRRCQESCRPGCYLRSDRCYRLEVQQVQVGTQSCGPAIAGHCPPGCHRNGHGCVMPRYAPRTHEVPCR